MQSGRRAAPLWPGSGFRWPVRDAARRQPVRGGEVNCVASLRSGRRGGPGSPRAGVTGFGTCHAHGRLVELGCTQQLGLRPPVSTGGNRDHGASNGGKGRPSQALVPGGEGTVLTPPPLGRLGHRANLGAETNSSRGTNNPWGGLSVADVGEPAVGGSRWSVPGFPLGSTQQFHARPAASSASGRSGWPCHRASAAASWTRRSLLLPAPDGLEPLPRLPHRGGLRGTVPSSEARVAAIPARAGSRPPPFPRRCRGNRPAGARRATWPGRAGRGSPKPARAQGLAAVGALMVPGRASKARSGAWICVAMTI
jgi:hypothetical protein